MNGRHLMRDVVFWLSAFSCGSALFTAALALRMLRANPRRYLSFAGFKLGYAIVVGVVLLRLILPAFEISPDPWAYAYVLGLAMAGAASIGVGRAVREEFVEYEARRKGLQK